jgi:uncharacterized protein YcfJ
MRKLLPSLVLSAAIAFTGVAHAQPAPTGTPTTRPSITVPLPSVSLPSSTPAAVTVTDQSGNMSSMSAGELCTIGVGVVVGAVLFQGVMWHGMTIMGAALGGWVGNYIYNRNEVQKGGA